jgi:ribosomal protein S18 acetylase RimI-like enzyme
VTVVVTEAPRRWEARRGGEVVGTLVAWVRPDGRCFLFVSDCAPEAYGSLLDAALGELDRDVYLEGEATDELTERGFVVHRREHLYVLPTDVPQPVSLPDGFAVVSAADADVDRLRELDEELRQDVPGTAGWRNEPGAFARETFQDPEFDAATYLVAVEGGTGAYAGLVRVWIRGDGRAPRLGSIGVRSAHRKRGLARALMTRVLGVLHERGTPEVVTEADETNAASNALMASFGARRIGGTVELLRAARP